MKPNRPVFVVLNARSGRGAVRERIESLRAGFRAASGTEPRLFVARSGKHLAGIATDAVSQARLEAEVHLTGRSHGPGDEGLEVAQRRRNDRAGPWFGFVESFLLR